MSFPHQEQLKVQFYLQVSQKLHTIYEINRQMIRSHLGYAVGGSQDVRPDQSAIIGK